MGRSWSDPPKHRPMKHYPKPGKTGGKQNNGCVLFLVAFIGATALFVYMVGRVFV